MKDVKSANLSQLPAKGMSTYDQRPIGRIAVVIILLQKCLPHSAITPQGTTGRLNTLRERTRLRDTSDHFKLLAQILPCAEEASLDLAVDEAKLREAVTHDGREIWSLKGSWKAISIVLGR